MQGSGHVVMCDDCKANEKGTHRLRQRLRCSGDLPQQQMTATALKDHHKRRKEALLAAKNAVERHKRAWLAEIINSAASILGFIIK